jgi:hypothetical protein
MYNSENMGKFIVYTAVLLATCVLDSVQGGSCREASLCCNGRGEFELNFVFFPDFN